MIKAIFFDLDGTLVNTLPLYIESYDKALKEHGFVFSDKKIVGTCFGKTEENICKNLDIPNKTTEFTKTYFAGVENHFNKAKLFEGTLEFLDLCVERQIKLAVISFAYRWYVDKMIKKHSLSKYFPIVIGYEDVKKPKPDPEAVFLACNKLEISPEDTMTVGDSKSDILMGKQANSKTVLFRPSNYNLFYDLETIKKANPDKIIQNLQQLKRSVFL